MLAKLEQTTLLKGYHMNINNGTVTSSKLPCVYFLM